MVEYSSEAMYMATATSNLDRICKLDLILDALLTTVLDAASTDSINEYQLDDGQTKIKTVYNGAEAVLRSINVLERTRQIYINRLNGRSFRMIDSRNMRR
mgnify:CR=1 FL=1|tara:strand:+ start:1871 stop:2170 length:300 start_codon:yes stop_codon:yes gene_type:complete